MSRLRLPARRLAETTTLAFEGAAFHVTVGFYPDGRPGEVFVHGAKVGSTMDRLLDDACVVVSRLLQHDVAPNELAGSMGRVSNDAPASILGALVDLVAAHALEGR